MPTELPTAAYFPSDSPYSAEASVELAIAFVLQHDPNPVVVVPYTRTLSWCEPLESFAKKRTVLTPLNDGRVRDNTRGRGMLVYAPALKEMELALRHSKGAPIAVVEDLAWSAEKWADEAGAANLVADPPRLHSTKRTADHEKILKAIDWAGNNGWHDVPGKRDLVRLLGELQSIGKLDKAEVVAYQLVQGRHHHYTALVELEKQIDKLIGKRDR